MNVCMCIFPLLSYVYNFGVSVLCLYIHVCVMVYLYFTCIMYVYVYECVYMHTSDYYFLEEVGRVTDSTHRDWLTINHSHKDSWHKRKCVS